MKNKLTIALLLAAVYLFWLLFSAPARLLTLLYRTARGSAKPRAPCGKEKPVRPAGAVLTSPIYAGSLAFRRGFPAGISRLTTPPACAAGPGCTV